jgi:hypothetical protein
MPSTRHAVPSTDPPTACTWASVSVLHPIEEGNEVECFEEIYANEGRTRSRLPGLRGHARGSRTTRMADPQSPRRTHHRKEASRYLGTVGGITVTEASIRGLIHRGRLGYRPGTTTFRLGDLLEVLTDMRAKEAA